MHYILFLACFSFITISCSGSGLNVTGSSMDDIPTCSHNLNSIFDLALSKFALKFDPITLPDIHLWRLTLSKPKISGLSSASRSCDITMKVDPITKDVEFKLCITVKEGLFKASTKLDVWVTTFHNEVQIMVKDLVIKVKASAPIKKGGPVVVTELSIEKLGEIRLQSAGFFGFLSWIANGLLKTQLKNIVVNSVSKKLPFVINNFLLKHPM